MSSATKICPHCGLTYPAEERFCPKDGTALRFETEAPTLVGQVLADRYLILKELGEGGMGKVYLGEHLRMKRKSAVKVMQRELSGDAAMVSRFNREAENASQIIHPNVAAIFDFGETADGLLYLAMEYVDGAPLTALLRRERALPPRRAARIVRQVADGLHAAHELGIVHRDLKPDNVMLTARRDGSDWAKVVDFGIAKAVNAGAGRTLTKTGYSLGTPEYMSPEQLSGDAVDARTDVYALGLIAFNLLTGDLPFPGGSSRESLILRLTSRPRTLAETVPRVGWPADVQLALGRALEADPVQRYASAVDFAADLERAMDAWGPAADVPAVAGAGPTLAVPSAALTPAAATTPTPSLVRQDAATRAVAPAASGAQAAASSGVHAPASSAAPALVVENTGRGSRAARLVAGTVAVVGLVGAGYLVALRSREPAAQASGGAGRAATGAPTKPASGTGARSSGTPSTFGGSRPGTSSRGASGSGQARQPDGARTPATPPATRPAPRDSAPARAPATPAPSTPVPPKADTAVRPRTTNELDSLVREAVRRGKVDSGTLSGLLDALMKKRDAAKRPQEQARLTYDIVLVRALMGEKTVACPQLLGASRMARDPARRAEARAHYAKVCLGP